MKDIADINDIQLLVDSFYNIAKVDELIGYIFTDVAKVNWEVHLPIIYNFWESILFGAAMYKGNPMEKHLALNLKEPLKVEHFDKWISIWNNTVDENFNGEIANKAKKQALLIKNLMLYKIEASNKRNSIK